MKMMEHPKNLIMCIINTTHPTPTHTRAHTYKAANKNIIVNSDSLREYHSIMPKRTKKMS